MDVKGRALFFLFALFVCLRTNDSTAARAKKSRARRRDDSGRPTAENRISRPSAGDRSVGKTSRRLPSLFGQPRSPRRDCMKNRAALRNAPRRRLQRRYAALSTSLWTGFAFALLAALIAFLVTSLVTRLPFRRRHRRSRHLSSPVRFSWEPLAKVRWCRVVCCLRAEQWTTNLAQRPLCSTQRRVTACVYFLYISD